MNIEKKNAIRTLISLLLIITFFVILLLVFLPTLMGFLNNNEEIIQNGTIEQGVVVDKDTSVHFSGGVPYHNYYIKIKIEDNDKTFNLLVGDLDDYKIGENIQVYVYKGRCMMVNPKNIVIYSYKMMITAILILILFVLWRYYFSIRLLKL